MWNFLLFFSHWSDAVRLLEWVSVCASVCAYVCARACVRVCVCDHLIGFLGFVASLPPHSRRGTILCDPWPSPPSTRPRQHSTLKRGKERAACQKKAVQHTPTHTHIHRHTHTHTHTHRHRWEMNTHKKRTLYRQEETCRHTQRHANLHTHQDIHTWQHLRLTHKHTHIHTCRHWIQTYTEALHSC